MLAKLVQGSLDPEGIDDAARAVATELIPLFVEHPGARYGQWMADRTSGHVLVMTCWASLDALAASSAVDGEERALVAERLGLRIRAVHTLEVLGAHETAGIDGPGQRWAHATWVEGLVTDRRAPLRAMHRDAVLADTGSPGFCASYWLADLRSGNGLGLSIWTDLDQMRQHEPHGRRRRRWFEDAFGCRAYRVEEFEAIGAVAAGTIDLTGRVGQAAVT